MTDDNGVVHQMSKAIPAPYVGWDVWGLHGIAIREKDTLEEDLVLVVQAHCPECGDLVSLPIVVHGVAPTTTGGRELAVSLHETPHECLRLP